METMETSPNTNPQPHEPTDKIESSSNKKKLYVGIAVALLAVGIIGIGGYFAAITLVKKDTPPVASTPEYSDDVVHRANALPLDMRQAIQKNLGISPEEYIKQSDDTAALQATAEDNGAAYATSTAPQPTTPAETEKAARSTTYAGVWLDKNGKKNAAVTDSKAAKNFPSDVRVNIVRNSESDLNKGVDDVTSWAESLSQQDLGRVVSIGKNTEDNKVEVVATRTKGQPDLQLPAHLSPDTKVNYVAISEDAAKMPVDYSLPTATGDLRDAKQQTAAINGNVATFAQSRSDSNARLAQAPPMPGHPGPFVDILSEVMSGDRIWAMHQGEKGPVMSGCSFGFTGKNPQGQAIMYTAGHCGVGTPVPNTPKHIFIQGVDASGTNYAGTPVGGWEVIKYGEGRDYGTAKLTPEIQQKLRKGTVRTDGEPVKIDGYTAPVVGAPMCKSGASAGFTCGKIVTTKASFIGAGALIGNYKIISGFGATACMRAGDSGGAAFSGTKAVGISVRVATPNAIATVFGGGKSECKKQQGDGFFEKLLQTAYYYPMSTVMQELPGYTVDSGV